MTDNSHNLTERQDAAPFAIQMVEKFVNTCLDGGIDRTGLALTMMGAGADLLIAEWGAPRVLAVFDQLVDTAASARAS